VAADDRSCAAADIKPLDVLAGDLRRRRGSRLRRRRCRPHGEPQRAERDYRHTPHVFRLTQLVPARAGGGITGTKLRASLESPLPVYFAYAGYG